MNDITGVIVVLVSIACMFMAQRKNIARNTRAQYSLMGSLTAVLIAVEAGHRSEGGIAFLFAAAAAFSLVSLAMDYLKPTKPDA